MSTLTDVLHNPATAAAKLTPCPFCGAEAKIEDDDDVDGLLCSGCGFWWSFEGYFGDASAQVSAAWNKRPIEDALRAERDALLQRNRRLTWALRAIDTRLHREMAACPGIDGGDGVIYRVATERTLRQMCNVAVSATAERPEDA